MIDNPITFTSGQMTIMDILETRSHGGKKTISLDHIDIDTDTWIKYEAVHRLLFLILAYIECPSCIKKHKRRRRFPAHVVFDAGKDGNHALRRVTVGISDIYIFIYGFGYFKAGSSSDKEPFRDAVSVCNAYAAACRKIVGKSGKAIDLAPELVAFLMCGKAGQ